MDSIWWMGTSVRDLNRNLQWELPIEGPTTLNGVIIEILEAIPIEGICVLIAGYPIEVVEVDENMVKTAKLISTLRRYSQAKSENED